MSDYPTYQALATIRVKFDAVRADGVRRTNGQLAHFFGVRP
jgi:hypothetical protein